MRLPGGDDLRAPYRNAGAPALDLLGDVATVPEGVHSAVVEHQDLVGHVQDAKSLGDDDDRRSSVPHLLDCPAQGIFAFGVEAGIRLIQNDEPRIAEKGSRQAQALPLPAGQPHAALADIGLVALGKPHDRFMQPHHGSGGDHIIRRSLLQAGDVVPDGAAKKLDVLRKIAEIAVTAGGQPEADVGAVEAHMSGGGSDRAGDKPAKGRLPGP